MPMYCYRCPKCGRRFEQVRAIADRDSVVCECPGCNTKARRDFARQFASVATASKRWPMWSIFGGVHPSQIDEARAILRKHGTDAEFNSEGDVKLESRRHRRDVMKALGRYDLDAGYGDPTPQKRAA